VKKYINIEDIASYLKTTWQTFWPQETIIPKESSELEHDTDATDTTTALYNS